MNLQPIDLPSLARAVMWPVIAVIALAIYWRPLTDLAKTLAPRINKLSFKGLSLELAQVSEMRALETEIRQLDAGLVPQSGVTGLTGLLSQLQHGNQRDYIVIDLGSSAAHRWLTSRLYLLALLITLIDRSLCLVFVETVGDVRKRFVGTASPYRVRWALARAYSWLEASSAAAYAIVGGLYYSPPPGGVGWQVNPAMNFQFDPVSGFLSDMQLSMLVQQFLALIRAPQSPPGTVLPDADEWVLVGNLMSERAKWLDGPRIEHLLGSDLDASYITLLPNKTINDLSDVILRQKGRFVVVVEPDKTFHGLIDRSAVLESVASEFSKESSSNKS